MKRLSKDLLNLFIITIISCILVSDLFVNKGRSASFDGPTHLANIALFFKSISQGEWHVTWTDGFANYGMPLGLLAQQLTSYLGAVVNLFLNNVVVSYNITYLIGGLLSSIFVYWFLRLYFKEENSLLGAVFFCLAPYRIINIYIRGALPEFFSSVFLPLILIGTFYLFNKKIVKGFFILVTSFSLLILTHPMMLVVNAFLYIPYLLYLFFQNKKVVLLAIYFFAFGLAIGITGYYSIPLFIEIKYLYYGLAKNHLAPHQYMGFFNFLSPNWFYYYRDDIFTRGHFIKAGLLEMLVLITGFLFVVKDLLVKKTFKNNSFYWFLLVIALIVILFMTKWTEPLYNIFSVLNSYQYQWRLFSTFIFIPPIFLAFLSQKINNKLFVLVILMGILFLRFPQLYGKNYLVIPEREYFFYQENLHANVMNTIWSGEARYYPVKTIKPEIVSGKGEFRIKEMKPSTRIYEINAKTNIRMVDYTFYYPGWHAYVDNQEVVIQFQDPTYRGTITYDVPQGNHLVRLAFTNTKIRTLGQIISVLSIILLIVSLNLLKFLIINVKKI